MALDPGLTEGIAAPGLDQTLALDAARIGRWSWDPITDTVSWDEAMETCYGLVPGSFDGTLEMYLGCIHPDDRDEVATLVARARDKGIALRFEHRVVWPDGSVHWIEARGAVVPDDEGGIARMVGVGIDIDERKELEEVREYAAGLTATAELAAQLQDAERIAQLGSWYWERVENSVSLSTEMSRICGVSEERLTGQQFREVLSRFSHPDDQAILVEVPAAAMSEQRPFRVEQRVQAPGVSGWRVLVHRGEVVVDASGEVLGIRGTTQDVTEQRDAENALLAAHENLAQERRAVNVLHETLIRPEFPDVEGYEIGARYLAAAHEPEIGGDWYDSFELPDGRILFSVGDVGGHGIRAARLMAKLRHSTRAYALLDPDPIAILTRLDGFLGHFSQQHELATAVVGVLDPASGRVQVGSAGHLPPLHYRRTGAVFVEDAAGLLLGTGDTPTRRVATELDLSEGDAVILYTDGLIERRNRSLDDGMAELASAINDAAPASADRLVVAALDACLAGQKADDDVCVLVLRRT
jgi:sigma-B regulation protein RsbU (phosphoserine phosphatase)